MLYFGKDDYQMKFKKLSATQKWGYIFILPAVVYFLVFFSFPLMMAVKNSFLDINLLQPEKATFVGFQNWIRVATDPLFWKSMVNVMFNQVIFISLVFVISLGLAILLFNLKKFGAIFRTIYFMPIITSATVALIMFSYVTGAAGPIQLTAMKLGFIHQPVYWLADKWLPMIGVAIFSSWKWFGIQMIIFIGGLASIDKQIYEAADIDGVGTRARFFSITLPLLKPQIVFILTMNIINGLQMFQEVFQLFDIYGGQYHSALTPVLYLYERGFDKMKMGYASTIGLELAIIIFIFTQIQNRILKADEEGAS